MAFLHGKCNGLLVLDLSKSIKLITPSYSVATEGFNFGVIEPEFVMEALPKDLFYCRKCNTSVAMEEVEIICSVCREKVSPQEAVVRKDVNIVCESCDKGLSSNSDNVHPKILEIRNFISNKSRRSEKKSLLSILSQPVVL